MLRIEQLKKLKMLINQTEQINAANDATIAELKESSERTIQELKAGESKVSESANVANQVKRSRPQFVIRSQIQNRHKEKHRTFNSPSQKQPIKCLKAQQQSLIGKFNKRMIKCSPICNKLIRILI